MRLATKKDYWKTKEEKSKLSTTTRQIRANKSIQNCTNLNGTKCIKYFTASIKSQKPLLLQNGECITKFNV